MQQANLVTQHTTEHRPHPTLTAHKRGVSLRTQTGGHTGGTTGRLGRAAALAGKKHPGPRLSWCTGCFVFRVSAPPFCLGLVMLHVSQARCHSTCEASICNSVVGAVQRALWRKYSVLEFLVVWVRWIRGAADFVSTCHLPRLFVTHMVGCSLLQRDAMIGR